MKRHSGRWNLGNVVSGLDAFCVQRMPLDLQRKKVSSHSLKCTMLSFAAKRGLSVPDRLMLGYHSSQMHMAMVYSRDGAAASLLLLEGLIDEIAKGNSNLTALVVDDWLHLQQVRRELKVMK